MKEENVKEIVEKYKELESNLNDYYKIQNELSQLRAGVVEVRNTKIEFLVEIYKKYERKDVLNCYGDIFYIDSKDKIDDFSTRYIGRRILWNLDLSDESYEIIETIELDDMGDLDCYIYEINVCDSNE